MAKWEELDTSQLSVCKEPAAVPPSSCYDTTDMITVRVEDASKVKDYVFFRQVLAWHSSYFAAATDPTGGFLTNDAKVLELQGSHVVFDAFHCWIYTGRLMDPPASDTPLDDRTLTSMVLYDIWFFADIRGIPCLGNSAIDMLHVRWTSSWVSPTAIKYVYDNTMVGSKLREMLVSFYSKATTSQRFKRYTNIDPTIEFLHDVYPLLAEKGETSATRAEMIKLDRCRWHDHSGPGGKQRLESRKKRNADQMDK